MSKQAIVERILSDAQNEASAIVTDAREKASQITAQAEAQAEETKRSTCAEVAVLTEDLFKRRQAGARLDCSKIELAERRKVLTSVYEKALNALCSLGKQEMLALLSSLLTEYAENGDEVVLADGMSYKAEVASLAVIKERNLKVSTKTAPIKGGFLLIGAKCDKNVSFETLLATDREENEGEMAKALFDVK